MIFLLIWGKLRAIGSLYKGISGLLTDVIEVKLGISDGLILRGFCLYESVSIFF